jgi:RHH-type rel operon transcriptional repressor/antitoxin RelB
MLAIRLPEDIEKRLADLAAKTGRTKTFYARQAILEYLDDLEDVYLADQRVDKLKEHRETYSIDDVEKEIDN